MTEGSGNQHVLTVPTFSVDYLARLKNTFDLYPLAQIEALGLALLDCLKTGKQVFIFGNGGSAGNAIHLANDLIYGVSRRFGLGIRVHALPANSSVISCLANDEGYESIFSYQLAVLARPDDVVIALSGSGNSPNILRALEYARTARLRTFAILGFSGGKAISHVDCPIHIPVSDMQLSEDAQLIIGHLLMQWLFVATSQITSKK